MLSYGETVRKSFKGVKTNKKKIAFLLSSNFVPNWSLLYTCSDQ